MVMTNHEVPLGDWGLADCTVAEPASRVETVRVAAGQNESMGRVVGDRNIRVAIMVVADTTSLTGDRTSASDAPFMKRSLHNCGAHERHWLNASLDLAIRKVVYLFYVHLCTTEKMDPIIGLLG